jgi:hypothetical protein
MQTPEGTVAALRYADDARECVFPYVGTLLNETLPESLSSTPSGARPGVHDYSQGPRGRGEARTGGAGVMTCRARSAGGSSPPPDQGVAVACVNHQCLTYPAGSLYRRRSPSSRLFGVDLDHPLTGFGHLIVDRDPLYAAHFPTLLQAAGVQLLRLSSRSPNLNAYAERFVRSIKGECLRHIVPLGARHLRAVVREFVEHYHAERNHQSLGNVVPFPSPNSVIAVGRVGQRQRL